MNADVHSLAGPYALHALPDFERAMFEAHLAECASCRQDVQELAVTAARMGAAVPEMPPMDMKSRVLAEVRQTRQLPPIGGRIPKQRGEVGRRLLLAAACLVAVGAVGVAGVQVMRGNDSDRQRAQIAAIVGAPDSKTVHKNVEGGGRVTLVVSQQQGSAVVVLDRLPRIKSDKTFQLWTMKGTNASSAGLLPGDTPQPVTRIVAAGNADGFGLSVEPAGGSKTPTNVVAAVPFN